MNLADKITETYEVAKGLLEYLLDHRVEAREAWVETGQVPPAYLAALDQARKALSDQSTLLFRYREKNPDAGLDDIIQSAAFSRVMVEHVAKIIQAGPGAL